MFSIYFQVEATTMLPTVGCITEFGKFLAATASFNNAKLNVIKRGFIYIAGCNWTKTRH